MVVDNLSGLTTRVTQKRFAQEYYRHIFSALSDLKLPVADGGIDTAVLIIHHVNRETLTLNVRPTAANLARQ